MTVQVYELLSDIKIVDMDTDAIGPYGLWSPSRSAKRWEVEVLPVILDKDRQRDVWLSGESR